MPPVNDQPGPQDDARGPDDADDIDLEPVTDDTADVATVRWRLAAVAGFLSLFHLAFALAKVTGPAAANTASSDAPEWTLLLRAAVAGIACALLL